jgi:hypothetical protein
MPPHVTSDACGCIMTHPSLDGCHRRSFVMKRRRATGRDGDAAATAADATEPESSSHAEGSDGASPLAVLQCRQCRVVVGDTTSLVAHNPLGGLTLTRASSVTRAAEDRTSHEVRDRGGCTSNRVLYSGRNYKKTRAVHASAANGRLLLLSPCLPLLTGRQSSSNPPLPPEPLSVLGGLWFQDRLFVCPPPPANQTPRCPSPVRRPASTVSDFPSPGVFRVRPPPHTKQASSARPPAHHRAPRTVQVRDRGCTYAVLLCASCDATLGRWYLTTPRALDALRDRFTFDEVRRCCRRALAVRTRHEQISSLRNFSQCERGGPAG